MRIVSRKSYFVTLFFWRRYQEIGFCVCSWLVPRRSSELQRGDEWILIKLSRWQLIYAFPGRSISHADQDTYIACLSEGATNMTVQCWTHSILSVSALVLGSQTGLAYSTTGHTRERYAISLVSFEHLSSLQFKNKHMLFVRAVIVSIWISSCGICAGWYSCFWQSLLFEGLVVDLLLWFGWASFVDVGQGLAFKWMARHHQVFLQLLNIFFIFLSNDIVFLKFTLIDWLTDIICKKKRLSTGNRHWISQTLPRPVY